MTNDFASILFERADDRPDSPGVPAFFRDLNLDQIVDAITAGRQDYDLKPFFHAPLHSASAVEYRHEIVRDLEDAAMFESVRAFSERMRETRSHLEQSARLRQPYQKKRWLLEAADVYGAAIERFADDLRGSGCHARGFRAFGESLSRYVASDGFRALRDATRRVKTALAAIRYTLHIEGSGVTVCNRGDEIDYGAAVEETFARFKQGAVKDYLLKLPTSGDLNHVEASVLNLVARRNSEAFGALDEYATRYRDFLTPLVVVFDREIQFYVAWLDYAKIFRDAALPLCYPRVSNMDKHVVNREGYDLALARKLIREKAPVVCNDFELSGTERVFIVTGPNTGGKTTFARTFGQLHYLASLGLPVAGSEARLFLCDQLFTHFERPESVTTLRGKLQDDLVRIHAILSTATPQSIVIMNEIFSSTSLEDATFLGRKIMEQLSRLDALGVCVTFLDELTGLNEKTVSLVALVAPDDPTRRTHKLARRPAEGISYALALAEKHRLTYEQLKARIAP